MIQQEEQGSMIQQEEQGSMIQQEEHLFSASSGDEP